MATTRIEDRLDKALADERWPQARALILRELKTDPDNHWLLTQLGVTLYEEKRYSESLAVFESSLAIVDDCPLTQWNIGGALDMLGRPREAIRHYLWILNQNSTDDPCWESVEWTASLRADCLYRLGHCYRQLKQNAKAARCFRQYLELLYVGVTGIYTADDTAKSLALVTVKPSALQFTRRVNDIIHHATNGKSKASSTLTHA
ncbi:hypothetical protein BH11PLA2_BH11PLA2_07600 [soil metagenome]